MSFAKSFKHGEVAVEGRQTIVALEGEDYSPSVVLALKIARCFNKPLEEVFTLK